MQFALHTHSSAQSYVADQQWRDAKLESCPLHPAGGCAFARHGSYPRAVPAGIRVARWYCPLGGRTFSLLPDFLAARLPGLLESIEQILVTASGFSSINLAADALRTDDVTLASAIRWLRRRLQPVRDALLGVAGDQERQRADGTLMAIGIGYNFGKAQGLVGLRRSLATDILAQLPAPLGFASSKSVSPSRNPRVQHAMGPDIAAQSSNDVVVTTSRSCAHIESPHWTYKRAILLAPQGRKWLSGQHQARRG